RAPHFTCYDDVDRIIPGNRPPIEAEAAATAAWPAGTSDHLASMDHLYIVRLHIEIVVDGDESRLVPKIMAIACHAFAAGVACPVARQHARRWPAGRRSLGHRGLLLRRRWRRRRRRLDDMRRWWRRLGWLDRLAVLHLVLELALEGRELGLELVLFGLCAV